MDELERWVANSRGMGGKVRGIGGFVRVMGGFVWLSLAGCVAKLDG